MPWVRIDEEFAQHPKVAAAGPLGMAMQVAALCYCNKYLTDGIVPASVVPRLLNLEGLGMRMWQGELAGGGEDAAWELVVDDLLRAGLWEKVDGGYRIHDYHDYQPSKEAALKLRDDRKAAGSKGGQARAKQMLKQTPSKPQATVQAKSKPVPVTVPPEGGTGVEVVPGDSGEEVVTVADPQNASRPVAATNASAPSTADVHAVYDAWTATLPPGTRRSLNEPRRKAIRARLREYGLADCLDAARGWCNDPWPERANHNDVAILFRPGNFEKFRDLARNGPPPQRGGATWRAAQVAADMLARPPPAPAVPAIPAREPR